MNSQKLWQLTAVTILTICFLISCGAPTAASVAEAITITAMPAATATPVPPTNTPALTATSDLSTKILFIGESLISWNNGLDQIIEQLAASANPPLTIEADTVTIGRGSLEKLWKESKAAEVIGAGNYDVVVLQEDLWGTDISTFHEYTRKFDAEIKKAGAKTLLFMAWSVSYLELTTEEIAQAHRNIAAELGADVAPVALAWQRALAERPELKLVGPDGIHPSVHGTYLATNVVFATVFGRSSNSITYLPAAPSHDCATEEQDANSHNPALDAYAGKRVSGCMTEEEAAFLQRIAWETVQEYTATAAPPVTTPVAMDKGLMPPGSLLNAIWGNSANDVFAVGYDGNCCELILHYDGSTWSTMSKGTGFWINGVWGSSSSDIFAVGPSGTILHYDGKAWSPMKSGTNKTLITVWGSSGSDVFAVGENGTILHYDGKAWLPMENGWPVKPMTYPYRRGLGTSVYLFVVWGSSGQDVFAVGDFGTILHYDGKAWSAMSSGTTNSLGPIWGSSGSDVFIGGEEGTILHYDGSAWSPMKSKTTTNLWGGIWGTSGRNVFLAGDEGLILHYDGTAWSPMTSGTTSNFQSM